MNTVATFLALAYLVVVIGSIVACFSGAYRLDLVLVRTGIGLAAAIIGTDIGRGEWLLAALWLFNGIVLYRTLRNVHGLIAMSDEKARLEYDIARIHERIDEERK